MKTYTVTMYRVTGEMKITLDAEDRLKAEHEAKAYFDKKSRGWAESPVARLYRVEEEPK